jgi:hypothetical protein
VNAVLSTKAYHVPENPPSTNGPFGAVPAGGQPLPGLFAPGPCPLLAPGGPPAPSLGSVETPSAQATGCIYTHNKANTINITSIARREQTSLLETLPIIISPSMNFTY